METVNSIRLVVRGERRALGLSQEQVAKRAGVSREWLSVFERGKVNVELGLVLRLPEALDLEFAVESKVSTQRQSGWHYTRCLRKYCKTGRDSSSDYSPISEWEPSRTS